eukprot:scaffold133004_cov18-Tisochrysis_lutea.AAC.3
MEQGKTLADARGDVFRGLEVVEYACGMAPQLAGEMVGGTKNEGSTNFVTVVYQPNLLMMSGLAQASCHVVYS